MEGTSLDIVVTRCHEWIPVPSVGYQPDWDLVHGGVSDLSHDHRHCPAIQNRLGVGITLGMPYTARFHRNGSVDVTHLRGLEDDTVYHLDPRKTECGTIEREVVEGFDTTRLTLPGPDGGVRLRIFLIGDLRANAWILDGGVRVVSSVAAPVQYLLTPLPYHRYPQGCSVNQGLTSLSQSKPRQVTHLKIPIDLDFAQLKPGEESIEVSYRTPMVQWLPVVVPRVRLKI